jgi:predicted DCC family thiol-disulfide oxidoreductase YuxK
MEPYSYRNDPDVPYFPDDRAIIVFDGNCVLCSGFAQFVLKHDTRGLFRLLPAQTPLGAALYRHYGLAPTDYETNVLIENGLAFFKADSSIRMAQHLGLPWSMAAVLRILPVHQQDQLYNHVARNRFNWFGRRTECLMSIAGYEDRFLK